jgi:hypothetical protein
MVIRPTGVRWEKHGNIGGRNYNSYNTVVEKHERIRSVAGYVDGG